LIRGRRIVGGGPRHRHGPIEGDPPLFNTLHAMLSRRSDRPRRRPERRFRPGTDPGNADALARLERLEGRRLTARSAGIIVSD
jgi:hypothetical protein